MVLLQNLHGFWPIIGINHRRYQRIRVLLFNILEITKNTHVIQRYIGCYLHPSGPYFMLKEEAGKIQVVFGPQGYLLSKVINVCNGVDPTRPPDDLAHILGFSIGENLELFHAINALCISYHKGSFSGKSNLHINAL